VAINSFVDPKKFGREIPSDQTRHEAGRPRGRAGLSAGPRAHGPGRLIQKHLARSSRFGIVPIQALTQSERRDARPVGGAGSLACQRRTGHARMDTALTAVGPRRRTRRQGRNLRAGRCCCLSPTVVGELDRDETSCPAVNSSRPPLSRHIRALYDAFATTFPAASRTFAPCRLRICAYHSELERIPLARAALRAARPRASRSAPARPRCRP
jgi:hypothetical protein